MSHYKIMTYCFCFNLSIDEVPEGSTVATPDDLALLMKMVSPANDPLLSSTLESSPETWMESSWHKTSIIHWNYFISR